MVYNRKKERVTIMEQKELFARVFGAAPSLRASAAGRINLIGEHVDYCGGKVFPASLNLKCTVLARANGTDEIRVYADDLQIRQDLKLNSLGEYKTLPWGNYQAGVAYILKENGYPLVGCDMLFSCTVPFGSGLSSSAAIEVATAIALCEIAKIPYDLVEIAKLCRRAENDYCGVNCGIMDQFASAMGKKDCAVLLDCKTLEYEYVPLKLKDYAIVVANCNKPHNLVESKYNERRAEVEEALRLLKGEYPQISCLAEVTPAMLEASHCLSGKIYARAAHVAGECDRVRRAAACLKEGDIRTLGKLIDASHESLSKNYEVTGKELDTLAELSRSEEGCIGARMIGAGFGGCIIAIVEKDRVKAFEQHVGERYLHRIGYAASFYRTSVENGVVVEHLN